MEDDIESFASPVGGSAPAPASQDYDSNSYYQSVRSLYPHAIFTGGARSPKRNAQVGGVPNSMHLSGQALDFQVPGVPSHEVFATLKAHGLPMTESLDEGTHLHVGWAPKGQAHADVADFASPVQTDDISSFATPVQPSGPKPGAKGVFGQIGQTVGDLFIDHPDHAPNALETGIMGVANSAPIKGISGSYEQAALNGLVAQPVRAAMEATDNMFGQHIGQLKAAYPGHDDQWYHDKLHDLYGEALTQARANAYQQTKDNPYPGHQVANTAAAIVGQPEYFLAPGTGVGESAAARIASAGAINAGIAGASDVAAQGMDILEGQQKDYDVTRSLEQAAVGGVLGAGMHGAIEATPFVKGLFKNRGLDTKPQDVPTGTTSPLSPDRIQLNKDDAATYQHLLQNGDVDQIKEFFKGRQGPQPSFTDVNNWVNHRDLAQGNGQDTHLQPEFDYEKEYHRQAVEQHIGEATKNWKNAPDFEVIHSADDVQDPGIREQLKKEDKDGRALGLLGSDGKVRIFGSRIPDVDTANAVMYHEALGHFGLAQHLGTELDRTMKTLFDRNVGQFGVKARKWMKQNPGAYGGSEVTAMEEVMANASMEGRIPKSWKDAMSAKIYQFGRRMGLTKGYSDGEVRQILSMAHDAVINGKPDVRSNGFKSPLNLEGTGSNKFMYAGKKATGFDENNPRNFEGPDTKPRFEISDQTSRLIKPINVGDHFKLSEVLHHPELYKHYPELKNINVAGTDSGGKLHGFYAPNTKTIGVDIASRDPRGTLLHEIQHVIQHTEGHANGTTSAADKSAYRRSAGEIEARDTDMRKNMSDANRKLVEPYSSQGVAREDMIVDKPFYTRIEQAQQRGQRPVEQRNAMDQEQTDPSLLDHIDRLKQDPRFWSDPEFRKNVIELARTREPVDTSPKAEAPKYRTEAEARAQLKFMRGRSDPENESYGRLPITDVDVLHNRRLRYETQRPSEPGKANYLDPLIKQDKQERYDREFGDVPDHEIDRIARDFKNMNAGDKHPDTMPHISVYNNKGEVVGKFPSRRDAFEYIDKQPDGQHLGIDRYGTHNKFITRDQLQAAQNPNADVSDEALERTYQALQEEVDNRPERSWAEDRRTALELGVSPSAIKDLGETHPGDRSTRVMRTGLATQMMEARIAALEEKLDTPEWTIKDQADYMKAMLEKEYLVKRLWSETSEAARALKAAQAFKSYSLSNMKEIGERLRELQSGVAGLAEDPEEFLKFARSVKALRASGNPKGALSKIAGVNKPYGEQYLTSLHMNMMLSALSTHVKAPVDMGTGIARNVIEKVVALPISKARQLVGGKPGMTYAEIEGHLYGMIRAVTDAEVYKATAHAAKTGEGSFVTNGQRTPSNFANAYGTVSNPRIPGVSIPTDLISAQDTFFRSIEMSSQLYALGRREALAQLGPKASLDDIRTLGDNLARNPTLAMLKQAHDLADRTLLLNSNALNAAVDKAASYRPGMNKTQRAVAFAVKNLAPFIRVESNNLMNRVIERSPLFFLSRFARDELAAGGARRDIQLAKIAYGSTLLGMYWMAADPKKDKITGEGPENVAKFKELMAGGFMPRAVHENGGYSQANSLANSLNPFDLHNATATLVASAREAYETAKQPGQKMQAVKMALGSVIHSLGEMTWLSDAAPVSDALTARGTSAGQKVNQFIGNEAKTWVPNILGQTARLTDPYQHDLVDPNSISKTVANEVQSAIPGLSKGLPTKQSVYGDPIPNGASITGVHTWLPGGEGNNRKEVTEPTEVELSRLAKLSPAAIITPVQRTVKIDNPDDPDGDKISKKLTAAEFENYQHLAGRAIVNAVHDRMQEPDWATLSDKEKIDEIRTIQRDTKSDVRDDLFNGE